MVWHEKKSQSDLSAYGSPMLVFLKLINVSEKFGIIFFYNFVVDLAPQYHALFKVKNFLHYTLFELFGNHLILRC